MKDPSQTNQELLKEISALKNRIQKLERSEARHKRAEEALKESGDHLRTLLDLPLDNVALLMDTKGVLIECNANLPKRLGLKSDDIIGKCIFDFLPSDVAKSRKEKHQEVVRTHRPVRVEDETEGCWYEHVAYPIFDENGEVVRIAVFSYDITSRKKTEQALRESEDRYRSIFKNAVEGIYQASPEGRYLRVNPAFARIHGFDSPEEMMASVADIATQIFPNPAAWQKSREILEKEGSVVNFEFELYRKDKSKVWVSTSARAVRGDSGEVLHYEGMVEDITERKQAEEKLRESENRFRAIADYTYDWESWVDPLGKLLWINPGVSRLTGYTVEECMAMPDYPLPLIDRKDRARIARLFEEALRGTSDNDQEFRLRRKDGSVKWAAVSWQPIFDARGTPLGHRSSVRDITARKQAEEALKKSRDELELRVRERTAELQSAYDTLAENERLYRNLFDNASVGMFQSRFDGSGFIRINEAYATALGYESPEEAKSAITDTTTQLYADPENRRTLLAALERDEWYCAEQPRIRKDGSVMIARVAVRKVLSHDGTPAYLEGIVEDITERKRAEKALQESEEKYRSVVESSFVGFHIVQDDIYRFVNKGFCQITGYDYDELVNKVNPLDIIHPDDRKTVQFNLKKRMGSEANHVEYGCRVIKKDGQISYVKVFGTALLYNGRSAAAGTVIDVTRERDLEQQLLRTQKLEALGTLAGGIAHDFNNVLVGITGFTEMVRDDLPPDSLEHHRLGLVLKGAHRGRDLVRQILTFSRQAPCEQKPVTLGDIVEEGLKLLRPLLPAAVEIRSTSLTTDDTILADSGQIHQVLMNLCINGAQAMGKKGGVLEVTVTVDYFKKDMRSPGMKPGDYVTLTVRDTGSGMKPEVLERIFDPFFTTKTHGEGTGLGLSVVHGIVKNHGGFINVESEPGKGSVFSIHLPKLERETLAPGEELPLPGGKECILFVDDEDILVELSQERLTQTGYEVVATTSVLGALEIFKKEPRKFDLVITDYAMPDMTGVDFARKLLKVRSDIPIILCTGYSDDISADKATKAGIKEFLLKPQGKRELDLAIRRVLDIKTE
jgi:PAS domain S-box-containing protein